MQGYVVSRPVTVRSATQVKHLVASASLDSLNVSHVQINAVNEVKLLCDSLQRAYPDVPLDTLIRGVPHASLAQWPHFPMVLGRQAADLARSEDVLTPQLQALQARHPGRQHLRLLIHNGFGSNLGDTLMGLTAFRAVWPVLKAHFPEVTVDVLLGWPPRDAVARLILQCEGVEQVLQQGPSLQALSRYQALIDTSGLITLPRYGSMPVVDWYLWWMGLDPARVDVVDKRNRIALDPDDMALVAAHLRPLGGPRILLNPMASEALRRVPLAAVQALAQALLASDPALHVVFDQPLAFEHPRALHLSHLIDSPARLAALVAQVDGVVTPDTFVQHLADATATPSCTLSTSVPASFYPYYPFNEVVLLPGAESLTAWGKTKVDEADWARMKQDYFAAWARLDSRSVMAALGRARAARAAVPAAMPVRMEALCLPRPVALVRRSASGAGPQVPLRQRADALAAALQQQLTVLGASQLLSGDTVALLGAGSGELALALAARVAPVGRVVAFEPRRLIHQILCANLVQAGCDGVETHPVLPVGAGFALHMLPRLMPQDEHVASAMGSQQVGEPVPGWPLDLLNLPQCRLIVIQTPVPLLAALKGALKTITRLRPVIVAGGIQPEEVADWAAALQGLAYTVTMHRLADLDEVLAADPSARAAGMCVLVAGPAEGVATGVQK